MDGSRVHYMDFASTSAIRPASVAEAVHRFITDVGATPGRSGNRLAAEAGRVALKARQAVTRVLGLGADPARVAFSQNATMGLNMALVGTLEPGDTVVTTVFDHNSVLRPVHRLVSDRGVKARMIHGDTQGELDLEEARVLLEGAKLLVVNAASNVLGTCLPVGELAAMAHAAGSLLLVDAAQWGGHFAESLASQGADFVAFTGHKGLLGPQGIGGLWVREGVALTPVYAGGTGGSSQFREMPLAMPDRLEAGSSNGPGMAGLLAGIRFLEAEGVETLHAREAALKSRLWEGLESMSGVEVLSPRATDGVGIVTIRPRRIAPALLARRLDDEYGVLTRHGLNCAPEVHKMLGTLATGTVRLSLGWSSTEEDVDQALEGVDAITSAPGVPVP